MAAALGHPAFFQNQNAVGPLNGRQPVGDDEGGPADHQFIQRVLHQALAFRIQGGGRFVQDQNAGVLQNGPGDGDALALTAGKLAAALADLGFVAVRQLQDEVMGIGRLGRRHHFLPGRIQAPVKDVFKNGRAEQDGVLRHHRQLLAQGSHGDIADVDPVDADAAGLRIIEPRDQVGDGRFAGTARTDNGQHLSRFDVDRHVAQRRFARPVFEGHVFECHPALDWRQWFGARRVLDLRQGVQHLEYTLGGRHGPLNVAVDVAEPFHWIGNIDGIHQKGDQGPRCQVAANDFMSAIPDNHRHRQGGEKLDDRCQCRRQLGRFHLGIKVVHVFPVKSVDFIVLPDKQTDQPDGYDHFLQHGSNFGSPLLHRAAGLAQFRAENFHGFRHHRHGNQRQQRQLPVQVKHGDQRADQRQRFRGQFDDVLRQHPLQGGDIVGHVAENFAGLAAVEIGNGQALKLPEQMLAQVNDHLLADEGHQIRLAIDKKTPQGKYDHDAGGNGVEQHFILIDQYSIDHIPHDPGHVQAGRGRQDHAGNCHQGLWNIGLEILQQSQIDLGRTHVFLPDATSRTMDATLFTAPGSPRLTRTSFRSAAAWARTAGSVISRRAA